MSPSCIFLQERQDSPERVCGLDWGEGISDVCGLSLPIPNASSLVVISL